MLERFVDFYQNKPFPRTTLHGYILQMLWDIYNHDQRDEDEEEDNGQQQQEDNLSNDDDDDENEKRDSIVINEDIDTITNDEQKINEEIDENNENNNDDDEFGDDVVLKPNFSKYAEDQWDIVAFFNQNKVWQQFILTVSIQMEAQNATETQVPNMNVANNQEQLDQLLQNLLGPNNDGADTSDSTDSDSDSDEEDDL